MKWMKLSLRFIVFGILIFFGLPITVHGADVPISIHPILPENQLSESDGFYNLRMSPNQKQTLALEVTNNGDQPVTIHTEIVPATTASSGTVVYSSENIDNIDETNKFPLSTIAKTQGDVTIPANEKTTIDVEVTMPGEDITGILLGGVRISILDEANEEKEKKDEGFSIENEYAYVVAIQLSQKDDIPKPEIKILKIFPDQIAGRNTVMVNLQNPTNVLVGGVSYEAKVYRSGSQEILHQASYKDYQVAPTSNFNLPISWENKPFQAGTYMLKLKATSEKPEGSWEFEQEFTISDKEAKELNEKAVELDKDYTLYIIIGASVLLLLIILLILFIVLRKRKKKKQRRKKKNAGKGRKPANTKRPATNKRGEIKKRPAGSNNRPTKNGKKRK